jgi:transcriptional regulator with XRE-family HTH domain
MTENTIPWDDIRAKLLADPAVKAEYEVLKDEFNIASQLIALRSITGLTQREFAQVVGMKQSQLARIESGKQIPKLETLAKLAASAGYAVEVHFISLTPNQDKETENLNPLRIPVPEVNGKTLPPLALSVAKFLESDEAVRVREKLAGRSLSELAAELEQCMSLSEADDRVFAVKNVLAGSVNSGGSYRDCSVENDDEIELLDLAEELLEKLAEILESPEIA